MLVETDIHNKIEASILCGIYGDAFGVPFELWSSEFMQKKIKEIINKEDYIIDNNNNKIINKLVKTHKNDFIGQYSDDSEMVLATIDSIITNCGINNNLLKTFQKLYSAHRGYGSNTEKILRGEILIDENQNMISTSNGGLMRISPIAFWNFYSESFELERDIINDLKTTNHDSQESIQTCLLFSKIIIHFLNIKSHDNIQDFIMFIKNTINDQKFNLINDPVMDVINSFLNNQNELAIIHTLEVYSTNCIITIQKVLNAFLFHYNEPNMMIPYVNSYGGDTDTHCNLIGTLIGARDGMNQNDMLNSSIISKSEIEKIENYEKIKLLINEFTNIVIMRYKNLIDVKKTEINYYGL